MFATALCLAGTVTAVTWGTRPIVGFADATQKTIQPDRLLLDPKINERHEPTREEFAKLWDRPLRRVLYDPPPPKQVVRELPPLRVEVLGTIIEPENSMAIVRSEQGNVEYKRVGEAIGPVDSPANVVEIGADSIVVERADIRLTINVHGNDRR